MKHMKLHEKPRHAFPCFSVFRGSQNPSTAPQKICVSAFKSFAQNATFFLRIMRGLQVLSMLHWLR